MTIEIDGADRAPDSRMPAADRRKEPWAVVVLLMLIGVLNILDRTLPGFLAEPIRRDLDLSDTAIGFINGFGFLLVYAVAGIPIARLADRGRYASVIGGSLLLWSGMTALGGLARNGWLFGLSRIGVALGEAGSTPAAHAFIAQNFTKERRATALSLIGLGSPIGTLVALVGGGLLASSIGWRYTMILVGVFGVVLAPIAYFMLRGGQTDGQAAPTAAGQPGTTAGKWHDFLSLLRKRSALLIVAGASMIATAAYTMSAFGSAFFMRWHGLSVADTGVRIGLSSGALGIVVLLVSGAMADRLSRRDPRWLLRVVMIMQLAATPVSAAAFLLPSPNLAILCFAVASACMNGYVAPTVTALYRLVQPEMRARTSATLLFMTAIAGGMGPLGAGLLSDTLRPLVGDASLGYALLLVPALTLLAAAFFFAASRTYRRDVTDHGEPVPSAG